MGNMFRKKGMLVLVALIALVGVLAVVSFSDDSSNGSSALTMSNGPFDLATALDNAVSGDTITLSEDTTLSTDSTVSPGVTLDDGGFSLHIPAYVTLNVEGTFVSSGNLTVDFRGSIVISSSDPNMPGGVMYVDNGDNTTEITGSLEVYPNGTLNIGLNVSSTFECMGSGRLLVEGTMVVGYKALNSTVNVRSGTITGELQISDGSVFRIYNILTIGSPPTLMSELENKTVISGKVTLYTSSSPYILVYGQSGFSAANIKYPSVNTKFVAISSTYATEYKDMTGKGTIALPSTSSLRDYTIEWKDSSGKVITDDSNIQIGSADYVVIEGSVTKKTYTMSFAADKSIRWIVNGISIGSSGEVTDGAYGAAYNINIKPAPGYSDTPTIFMNGVPFAAGTSFTVTGDVSFTTSNNYPVQSENKVQILLALLCIVAIIFILVLVALVMKNRKKTE